MTARPAPEGGAPAEREAPSVPFTALSLDHPLLKGATGRGVRVAVVDSGVNPDNPHLGPIAGGVGIGPAGGEREDFTDRLGHGTAVTAAIQEKAPDAEIVAVKVFFDELATTLPGLVSALDRAAEAGARLVNLSLGSPNPDHEEPLREAVRRAAARGAVVVSPREHRGRRWWPGDLPGVVGVLLDWECPRDELRLMRDPRGAPLVRASGYPRPIPGVPPERNLRGISFAAANVTGLLACLLERRPELVTAEAVADAIRSP